MTKDIPDVVPNRCACPDCGSAFERPVTNTGSMTLKCPNCGHKVHVAPLPPTVTQRFAEKIS